MTPFFVFTALLSGAFFTLLTVFLLVGAITESYTEKQTELPPWAFLFIGAISLTFGLMLLIPSIHRYTLPASP